MSREAFEAARAEVGVIDTMIGFPKAREEQAKQYDFIRKQAKDDDREPSKWLRRRIVYHFMEQTL